MFFLCSHKCSDKSVSGKRSPEEDGDGERERKSNHLMTYPSGTSDRRSKDAVAGGRPFFLSLV